MAQAHTFAYLVGCQQMVRELLFLSQANSAARRTPMTPEVGVFKTRADAMNGIDRVLATGVKRDKISILTPAAPDQQLASVPLSDTEQPGMGPAVGTVVGGALGTAGGFGAGAAIASMLVP